MTGIESLAHAQLHRDLAVGVGPRWQVNDP